MRIRTLRASYGVLLLAVLAGGHLAAEVGRAQPADEREAATAAHFERIRDDPAALAEFLARMPVGADLHHHLSGGVRPTELIRMAAPDGLCLPVDASAVWSLLAPPCGRGRRPVGEALEDAAFHREIQRRWSMLDYLADDASIDRLKANDHFFALFEKLRGVQGRLAELLAAARSLAARGGVIYLETATGYVPDPAARNELNASLRWNDDLTVLRDTLRADPRFAEIRDATLEALPRELARSDGCSGAAATIPIRVAACWSGFSRQRCAPSSRRAVFAGLLLAYEIADASPLVVGINFAGPETHPVSVRDYDLHMRMFGALAPHYPDVKRSLHAGEMVIELASPLGAELHIRRALAPAEANGAGAHRLGHAVALQADPDPAGLLAEMKRRSVVVEISLESNRQLLGVGALDHPLVDYLAAGVPVMLATDDPGLMLSDLRRQFALAARNGAVTYTTLKALARNSIDHSFLPEADRRRLLRRLDGDFAAFEATPWDVAGR